MMNNNVIFGKRKEPEQVMVDVQTPIKNIYLGPDRRRAPRRKMLKTCKIIFNNHFSVFDGVMVNKSVTGAQLKVKNPAFIAPEFLLSTVFGNSQYLCSIMWRNGDFIGVQFEDI